MRIKPENILNMPDDRRSRRGAPYHLYNSGSGAVIECHRPALTRVYGELRIVGTALVMVAQ